MLKALKKLFTDPKSGFLSDFLVNTMLKSITAFNHILTSLCKIQKSAWDNEDPKWKLSEDAISTYKYVFQNPLQSMQSMGENHVEKFFSPSKSTKVNFFEEKIVLFLPPLEKDSGFVPILSFCCNLRKKHCIAKFRVMLVTLNENAKTKLNGIGFRMETPDGKGIHDFHHAQLIHQFSPKQFGNILQIKCLSWLPESQPSFPLPADCPVTLLLCIMITLYGWKYYKDFCDHIPTIHQYRNKIDSRMGMEQS